MTGHLAIDPPMENFDYRFGLNYLVARRAGVAPPPLLAAKGFDWRRGWSDAWTNTQEGGAYLRTLDHFLVKPDPDGQFRISGVGPGEYDLALHLYGATDGSLAHPAGVAVVRVRVPEGQPAVDLGTINVQLADR